MIFVFIIIVLQAAVLAQNAYPSTLCGNGRVDAGEDCDGSDCCDSLCRFRQGPCGRGLGVCSASGTCDTRESTCTSLDSYIFQFSVPQDGEKGIHGPYSSCFYRNASASPAALLKDVISQNQPLGSSVLHLLLPKYYLQQTSCAIECSGTGLNSNQPYCVSFNRFTAENQNLASGISCAVDNSASVKFGDLISDYTNRLDSNSSAVVSPFFELLTPGVCQAGTCVPSVCRNQFCNGKGTCVLSRGTTSLIQQSLGLSPITQSFDSSWPSLLQCACDDGYGGNNCEVSIPSNSGKYKPEPSIPKSDSSSTVSQNTFVIAMVSATLGTAALLSFCFYLMYLNYRRESDSEAISKPSEFSKNNLQSTEDNILRNIEIATREDPQKLKFGPAILTNSIADISNSALYQNSKGITQDNGDFMLPPNYLRAAHAYTPRLADEVQLLQGDILYLIKAFDDGWGKAYNLRTGKEGIFPLSFTKRIVVRTPNATATRETPVDLSINRNNNSNDKPEADDRRSSLSDE